jgi:hypothetical protein
MAGPVFSITLVFLLGHGQEGISIAELRQGLRDADAAIKNFTVTVEHKSQSWTPTINRLVSPATVRGVYTVEASGRARYEFAGERRDVSDKYVYQVQEKGVFDGKQQKSLEGDKERYLLGRVGEKPRLRWSFDPREYVLHYNNKSIADRTAEEGTILDGVVLRQGRRLVGVASKARVNPDGAKARYHFLIDCERGFSVVRRSMQIYRPATREWFDYSLTETSDYAEVSPGIWLPARVRKTGYDRSVTNLNPAVVFKHEIQNTNWIVNADLPDSLFTLEYPPGIVIQDDQTGKQYQTVEIKDDMMTRWVGDALEIYKEEKEASYRKGILVGGGAIVLASLVAASCLLVARRRRLGADLKSPPAG